MKQLINTLRILIDIAKQLGLPDSDLMNAIDFLEHDEYGLCFDTIVTQMYEYDIEIDDEFYSLLICISVKLVLSSDSYSFMKELIRNENKIPEHVKEELLKIIKSLG